MTRTIFLFVWMFKLIYVSAQDANYWSPDYGPGGFMVPGATIAKNRDSGVLFYNPALLAYNTKNAATISGNIYSYQSTKIKNGAGTGLDLLSSSTAVTPVAASNTIYLKLKSPITIAYAIVYNPLMRIQASQRKDDQQNVLDDSYSPGKELFVGQYVTGNVINETTGMLSFGKPVSSKLAVGLSFSLNFRKQTYLDDYKSRTLINNSLSLSQKLVTVTEYYLVNNFNIGLGLKAGMSYDVTPRHHIGLLLSLPLIHLYGSGDLLTDYTINNLHYLNSDIFLLASSKQTKLKSKWKTPLSVAAGYTFDFEKTQVYFATEYFTRINEYNVLLPRNEQFIRPDTGSNKNYTASLLRLKDVHKAIMNFSIAASFPLINKFTGYCSFRTDFNYSGDELFNNEEGYKSNTSAWDLYHLQVGSNFKKRKFNLRAGILLAYGSTNKFKQPINFDNPNELNLLEGDLVNTKATRLGAGLIMAYIHNF